MTQVYITGDVHHPGCKTLDYRNGFTEEMKYVVEYLKILKKYKLKCTLFITGRCLEKNNVLWTHLQEKYDFEIGGHTYAAFDHYPVGLGFLFKLIYGCFYGPKIVQANDINQFFNIADNLGLKVVCWRTHAYSSNQTTRLLLKERGVRIISDTIGEKIEQKELLEVPITFFPDDLFFAERTTTHKSKWLAELMLTLSENEIIVLQLHPSIMKSLDDFDLFKQVCCLLSKMSHKTKTLSEVKLWD